MQICSGNERLKDDNDKKLHNTQKPEALLYRIIALFTSKGDLILDPFGGTMTTGAVAKRMGRNYTMIERDEKYIKYGQRRLDAIVPEIGDVENATFDEKPLKVSMKEMIEAGYFKIGEEFINKSGEVALLADDSGKLSYKGEIKSMHEIAAKMIGQTRRVNAFDYLFVIRDGIKKSINDVREDYRKHLLTDNSSGSNVSYTTTPKQLSLF